VLELQKKKYTLLCWGQSLHLLTVSPSSLRPRTRARSQLLTGLKEITCSQIILTLVLIFFLTKDDVQGFILACSLSDYTENRCTGLENVKQETFSQSTSLDHFWNTLWTRSPCLVSVGLISFSQCLKK